MFFSAAAIQKGKEPLWKETKLPLSKGAFAQLKPDPNCPGHRLFHLTGFAVSVIFHHYKLTGGISVRRLSVVYLSFANIFMSKANELNLVFDHEVLNILESMGCASNQSPELNEFLRRAILRFQKRSRGLDLFFDTQIISIASGLVDTCGDDPRLDRETLEQVGDRFVLLCGFAPEGTEIPPESDEIIEGSFRLIER